MQSLQLDIKDTVRQCGSSLRRLTLRVAGDVGCVQVAASADHHVVVRKALDGEGRALTRVMILAQEQERLAEVAAMMGVGQQEALQVLQASRG